ncbi:hypothetical protein MBAV_001053, partial [Candidatus Magnetobacterium bavaricum]
MMEKFDTSDLQVLLKVAKVNSGKFLDTMVCYYNKIFQISSEETRTIYMDIGDKGRTKGDFDGAIRAYKKVLKADPNNVDTLL